MIALRVPANGVIHNCYDNINALRKRFAKRYLDGGLC